MEYGFSLPDTIDETCYGNFKHQYQTTLDRRKTRWNAIRTSMNFNRKSRKLKRFVRKGIPNEYREEVWMKISGAEAQMLANNGLFDELLNTDISPEVGKTILADISRTFPENVNYRHSQTGNNKTKSLENVLRAFACRNPNIGYCQGLNYVAALFLLIIPSEEKVFWLFDTVVSRLLQPYYNPGMEGVHVDCFVLEELIRLKMPKVYQTMKTIGTNCLAMCTKWFICLYVDVLPIETTLRILDCLIYEGDKILFRVAITLIKLNQAIFTSAETFPDFVVCFRKVLSNEHAIDCHSFMEKVFKQSDPLSYRSIKKIRKESLTRLENGLPPH